MIRTHLQEKPLTSSPHAPTKSQFAPRPFAPKAEEREAAQSNCCEPRIDFSLADIDMFPRPVIQPKLTLGPVGDKYEQEADRVARQVVDTISSSDRDTVQREEDEEEELNLEEEEEELRRMTDVSASGGADVGPDLESAIQRARGQGQPLSDRVRQPMERAFGADFGGVRLHTDGQADSLNRSIQARAFTTGQDIFLRQGEYRPGSSDGQRLLAHELTHVVQQNGGAVPAAADSANVSYRPARREAPAGGERSARSLPPRGERMGHARPQPSAEPVQRKLCRWKPSKDPSTKDEIELAKLAGQIDGCVDEAFDEFIKGDYSNASDAQRLLYLRRKMEYDYAKMYNTSYSMHPSTAAGYVIEGKANDKIKKKVPQAEIQVTDLLKGTRPDIYFKAKSDATGLVDITAQNSIGHIFKKSGNWLGQKNIVYVAESWYPSIDFDKMQPVKLSVEDQQNLVNAAEDKKLLLQETWDYWRERFESEQKSIKNLIEWDFNKNNVEPFKGTERQASGVANKFKVVGLKASLSRGSKELSIDHEYPFDKMSDVKELKPYKIDEYKCNELGSLLMSDSMSRLIKGA